MAKKYRQFTAEFKQQVVNEIESGAISATQATRKYQISPNLVRTWRERAGSGTLAATPSKRERELEKELERYKTLLAEAVAEREWLKKAHETARRVRLLKTSVITGLDISPSRGAAE